MKRVVLILLMLIVCTCSMSACTDIVMTLNEDTSIRELNSLAEKHEQAGHRVVRLGQDEVISFNESIVAEEGLMLKGSLTGMLEYDYTDPKTGEYTWGVAVGTRHNDDAKAIAKMYESMGETLDNVQTKVTNRGLIVEVEYSYAK